MRWVRDSVLALVEILGAPLLAAALLVAKAYRRWSWFGARRSPAANWLYRRIGVYPVIDHFYDPFPTAPQEGPRNLPAVQLDLDEQVRFLSELVWAKEVQRLAPLADNESYRHGDVDLLYQMLRRFRPTAMIEVGSGHSTRVARAALDANRAEGSACRHVCVEPYPLPWLGDLDVEVIRQQVETVDLSLFADLRAGDVLFIDSSHMIRPRGDVLHLYLTVLPLLAHGVVVHVHDIFTPWDYPRRWLADDLRLWNEQYLLEAMLSGGDKLKPLVSAQALWRERSRDLLSVCPLMAGGDGNPGSFWMQVQGVSAS